MAPRTTKNKTTPLTEQTFDTALAALAESLSTMLADPNLLPRDRTNAVHELRLVLKDLHAARPAVVEDDDPVEAIRFRVLGK